ncbi:Putative methyltransferase [Streptomyces antimycoticus]
MDRPLREVDPPVLDVLNLGAHQLLGTRIPTHAAVSASVELARVVLGDGRAKFVNAVLRRIAAHDLDGWLERVAPPYDEDPEEHLGVRHSHPRWVVSALWDALGGGSSGIEELLAADNERPEVTLVARPGRSTAGELLDAVGEGSAVPGRWSPVRGEAHRGRRARGAGGGARGARRGAGRGQPTRGPGAGERAAGGGGPALAGRLRGPRRQGRAARRRSPRSAAPRCSPRRSSRTAPGWWPGPWPARPRPVPGDRRGRHPARRGGRAPSTGCWWTCRAPGSVRCGAAEARWRRRPEDLDGFAPLQRGLLREALASARIGGVVGYATCSPHPAETRAVVEDVLKGRGGPAVAAEWIDARPLLPGVPELGDWPGHPAVAAPARYGRHVSGPAAPHRLTAPVLLAGSRVPGSKASHGRGERRRQSFGTAGSASCGRSVGA